MGYETELGCVTDAALDEGGAGEFDGVATAALGDAVNGELEAWGDGELEA